MLAGMTEAASFDSAAYWQARYLAGGNSGAGSYGRLSVYKAHVVNELCHRKKIRSVAEFGSGDGNQSSLFSIPRYCGVDVSQTSTDQCRQRFAGVPDWSFVTSAEFRAHPAEFDLALSLDVIFHLIEDEVFDAYMRQLFATARRFVLIYSSDHNGETKAPHVRHRAYSAWIAGQMPGWGLSKTWRQPFAARKNSDPMQTSFAFFRLFARKAAQ